MNQLPAHFFRHEYGKLVSTLARRFGSESIEVVEDAVQTALMTAVERWPHCGLPNNPSAWLFRVAHNELMSSLRQRNGRRVILANHYRTKEVSNTAHQVYLAQEIDDDLLAMLFVCCDDSIPEDSQLVLALKILCGLGVREIALRLFISEANVYKRLARGRSSLANRQHLSPLSHQHYSPRLQGVQKVLYLLFTEGYLAFHGAFAIRKELCDEAIRLAELLAKHPVGQTPETAALLALLYFHVARISARQDSAGGLLLLEEQNRADWDQRFIAIGMSWLAKSAKGKQFSRYHAEAGVAAEHCLAPSFSETRWDKIVECYALLERVAPSPIHQLNRAVAVAQWKGPQAGLDILAAASPSHRLEQSVLWSSVLADLHRRCGHEETAEHFRKVALQSAPTAAVRALLRRRLIPPQT